MATITPRQPFGMVGESRLRNLTNVKNSQNAILPTPAKSLKRAYEPEELTSDNDNENIDPAVFLSPSKKAKGLDGLAANPLKPQKFFLKSSSSASSFKTRPIATPKRLSLATQKATPISAPAGGRSPTKKRVGILSRRRVTASPFTRAEPQSFTRSGGNGMPFSLDAALSNTVPGLASKTSAPVTDLKDGKRSSWFFDIHEDTPEEEMSNFVQHSTQILDISDDEGKIAERNDRGKENVPPADYAYVPPPVSRADRMTEEVRTPLGDLNAEDYYSAGCDATSVFIIPEDQEFSFDFSSSSSKKAETASDLLKEVLSKTSNPTTPIEAQEMSNEIIKSEGPITIYESEGTPEA